MSFESGRKLGLTASLIAVLMPVIIGIVYVLLIFSSITRSFSGSNPSSSGLSPFPLSTIILFSLVGAITLAGLILFVISMHRLSQYYNEPSIFKNTLYAFIINIVGTITAIAIEAALIGNLTRSITPTNTQTTAVTPIPTVPPITNIFVQLIVGFLVLAAVALVLGIVSAILYMRAFNKLGEKSRVDTFKTAGLLYLIGAVLTIVGVGILLIWIAWIFAALGFNSLKPSPTPTTPTYSTVQPPAIQPQLTGLTQKRYCTYCGTENNFDAIYCRACGKQLQ